MKPRHEWRWKQQKIAVEKKRQGYAENATIIAGSGGVGGGGYYPNYQKPMQYQYPYQRPVYPPVWQPWPTYQGFQNQQFYRTPCEKENKESS